MSENIIRFKTSLPILLQLEPVALKPTWATLTMAQAEEEVETFQSYVHHGTIRALFSSRVLALGN